MMKKGVNRYFVKNTSKNWLVSFTEGYAETENVINMNHFDATNATILI